MAEDLVVHFGGSLVQSMTFQKKKRKWYHWKWFDSAVKGLPVIDCDADLQRIGHPYLFLIMTQANWFVFMSIKFWVMLLTCQKATTISQYFYFSMSKKCNLEML